MNSEAHSTDVTEPQSPLGYAQREAIDTYLGKKLTVILPVLTTIGGIVGWAIGSISNAAIDTKLAEMTVDYGQRLDAQRDRAREQMEDALASLSEYASSATREVFRTTEQAEGLKDTTARAKKAADVALTEATKLQDVLAGGIATAVEQLKNDSGFREQVLAQLDLQPGTIVAFAGRIAPPGWLVLDGAILDSTAHPEYRQLQVFLTGESSLPGRFGLPDFRRRFLRGAGATDFLPLSMQPWSTGLPRNRFATTPSGVHNHGGTASDGSANVVRWGTGDRRPEGPVSPGDIRGTNPPIVVTITSDGQHDHQVSGGGDEETRPDNVAVTWIIKY